MDGFEKVEFNDKHSAKRSVVITVAVVLLVAVLAIGVGLIVRFYVISTFVVNGDSMAPTLNGGDIDIDDDGDLLYLNKVAKIKRGDIVVFTMEWSDALSDSRALVKRVVAVAGDHIQIIGNVLYINGEEKQEDYINGAMNTADLDLWVSEGHIFCMGDNRNHSSDSRMIGEVPLSSVVGKCFLIKTASGKLRRP